VAIGIGAGSEQRASIAGDDHRRQTLCLLLTTAVVPVAYSYLAEFESAPWGEWANRIFVKARGTVRSSDSLRSCPRQSRPSEDAGDS